MDINASVAQKILGACVVPGAYDKNDLVHTRMASKGLNSIEDDRLTGER